MSKVEETLMEVNCTECHFSRTVSTDGETLPADIIQEHGQETGHSLSVTSLDEE